MRRNGFDSIGRDRWVALSALLIEGSRAALEYVRETVPAEKPSSVLVIRHSTP